MDEPFRPRRATLMLRDGVILAGRFLRALRAGGVRHALSAAAGGMVRRGGGATAEDLAGLRAEVATLRRALADARSASMAGAPPPLGEPDSEATAALRVLYALEFYPHASETYIATELAWMRRQGVSVEVWSERSAPVADASGVPVHRGDLAEAIASFRPQLVHGHHLEQALGYAPLVAADGLPMTVRAHGFALDAAKLAAIAASPAIATVFHFPHLLGPRSTPGAEKVRPMTCCFDPALCHPGGEKDPRLVVRTGLASPTKDLGMFLRLATRFPRHRFVLIPCWSYGHPDHLEELAAQNRALGNPVDLRPNLPHADVMAIVRRAGVYLHTHALADDYGMPISIAEAMATGCHVIARRGPSTPAYLGTVGSLYDSEDEAAACLRDTESWDAARWRTARLAAIERAYAAFAAPEVLPPLLAEWRRLMSERSARRACTGPPTDSRPMGRPRAPAPLHPLPNPRRTSNRVL